MRKPEALATGLVPEDAEYLSPRCSQVEEEAAPNTVDSHCGGTHSPTAVGAFGPLWGPGGKCPGWSGIGKPPEGGGI